MFEIIFLFFISIYFLVLVYLTSGLSNHYKTILFKPFVSVIIAARNEEENISDCLDSLAAQEYNHFEVLIADDFSSDGTGEIINKFVSKDSRFRKIIPPDLINKTGKTNALISAIQESKGEILLFTDADCKLHREWISSVTSYYTPGVGMVNGYSITETGSILKGIQSLDLLFLTSVAAGMANNGKPASCIGNNMSVNRKAYGETGGFELLPGSITEDYLLLDSVSRKNYKIIFPLDESLLVRTRTEESFSDLMNQKKRWASGGLGVKNISIYLMMLSFIVNLLVTLSIVFYSPQIFALVIFKISSDLFFLYNIHKKFNLTANLKYFLFFEAYYIFYTTFLPLTLLFNRRITWKGRQY